eukprot:CAMPEP_0172301674 /NCGR_PEP_ID=MMETSP1058-20130122/3517_1 /TAXON_ID=83371 /ORGANISM="Detonula confervacea, Strain CCMP 353" /LENGTH=566 /DNA_ID=CAMNT_0013011885 /DNA_START=96 /DNA_END=1796 /DNA_ORIENTATION=-
MKSSPTCTRRNNLLVSTALLLAGAPGSTVARSLRRSGGSSIIIDDGFEVVSSNDRLIFEDEGFEVVGGSLEHVPLVHADENNSTAYEWHRSMLHAQEQEEDVEPKEYINDESLAFVDPEDSEHNRIEKSCGANEMLWTFRIRTDQYAYETSWKLEELGDNGWKQLVYGPPKPYKYDDNRVYTGARCLPGDRMYRLSVMDAGQDGICCNYGSGTYSYRVNGLTEFDSARQRSFTDKSDHSFYVGLPVPQNNGNGNTGANANNPILSGRASVCGPNKQQIGIKMKMDRFGDENSWELRSLGTDRVVVQRGLGSYGSGSTDMVEVCVPYGKYKFTITDGVGDGICCQQGDGRYELYMDGELMVYGSEYIYGKKRSHVINVGYYTQLNQMSQREIQYLNCHNWRRKKYHERYGAQYVPLKYDLSLAEDAKSWATKLLDECSVNGIKHEPGAEQGENLAKNKGTPNGSYGRQYPVENICRRWFEREETWAYPYNAHLTQGLWRSARYVGCAESSKTMQGDLRLCHVQVCRYARAGNCNMGKWNSNVGDNWKTPMLMDHNPCGPICPPKGCH